MKHIPEEYLIGGLPNLTSDEYFLLLDESSIHLDELDTKRRRRVDAKAYKKKLKEYFENKCAYCGIVSKNPTIDHVIPKSKSGLDDTSNWIPACRSCNLNKGDSIAFTWFKAQKFYNVARWNRIVSVLTGEINVLAQDYSHFHDLLDKH